MAVRTVVRLEDVQAWENEGSLLTRLVDECVPSGVDENNHVVLEPPRWFKQYVEAESQRQIMTRLHEIVEKVIVACIDSR